MQEHEAIMMYVRCGNYESDAESLFRYVAHNYGARHQVVRTATVHMASQMALRAEVEQMRKAQARQLAAAEDAKKVKAGGKKGKKGKKKGLLADELPMAVIPRTALDFSLGVRTAVCRRRPPPPPPPGCI